MKFTKRYLEMSIENLLRFFTRNSKWGKYQPSAVCPFVLFLLAIMLAGLLRYTDSH